MAITRDSDYPAAPAQLLQSFNGCADGHAVTDVLEAAGNLLMASIGHYAALKKMNEKETMEMARSVCHSVFAGVERNWRREVRPTDIEVKAN